MSFIQRAWLYITRKTQNADFAGDFAVYVDDYAEWICHQAFDRCGGAVARQNAHACFTLAK